MDIKQRILSELSSPDFPNLEFLYRPDSLVLAAEVLSELLDKEKEDFRKKLETPDSEISFDTFEDFSTLDYYFSILEHYQGVHSDDTIRKIIEGFEPQYIDFGNEISYSKRYYEMLRIAIEKGDMNEQQTRIITKSIEAFEVRWIALEWEKQDELKSISKRLSELSQKFSNNVVDSKKDFEYIVTDESIMSEMPEDDRKIALKRAEKICKKWYLFDSSQSSYMSVMKYCSDSEVRKHFYEFRQSVASNWEYNNKWLILEILQLRERKAILLGFNNYAELSLKFKMADSPEQVIELFSEISSKWKVKAQSEIDEITQYFHLEDIQTWDISYYANKLREEKYSLDSKELKKYLLFDNVLWAMFETIFKLYKLEFREIQVDTYNESVTIYEVYKEWEFISYFFTDYFYNELKRPWAWANMIREKYWKNKKIVLNVCNFQKWIDGQTLLTMWDVETMFHEAGHAIHEMLSTSEYSELSGFHVEHDFIELPSQLLENWCRDREWMKLFARHHKTGEEVPKDMLTKLEKLDTFWNGQFILAQNIFAMLDMSLHSQKIPRTEQELDDIAHKNHDTNSLLPRWEIYSPHTSFTHIFDGWYSAGYYSYMWAEIIEKEVWKVFKDSGDIFSPEIAKRFHDTILSAWTTKKASEMFQDFIWRDVQIDAFLSEKGLI